MSTRTITSHLDISAKEIAYNTPHTKMATIDDHGVVTSWQRDGDGRTWTSTGSFQPAHPPSKAAWTPPRFGSSTLAIASPDGSIQFWNTTTNNNTNNYSSPTSPWTLLSTFKHTSLPILDLVPASDDDFDHPLIAACCADGHLRMYAPTAPGDQWELFYEVRVTAPGSEGACTSASWCQRSINNNSTAVETPDSNNTTTTTTTAVLPPMLVIGTVTEGSSIWMLQEGIMKWKKVAALHDDNVNNKVVAVDWAPRLGRPHELIAVAYNNNRVEIWSVKGRSHAPQIDEVVVLDHEASVWQVKWNMFGNWLATSCDNGEICMWRPDFSGEWLLLNKVVAGGGDGDQQQTNGMQY